MTVTNLIRTVIQALSPLTSMTVTKLIQTVIQVLLTAGVDLTPLGPDIESKEKSIQTSHLTHII
jgi:hypothetical protein